MRDPTPATVKRLFGTSGMTCNYPGCDVPLLDEHGTVSVQMAHIAAANEGGPRYDPSMTSDERRGYDNLLLLCPNHHARVDGAPEAYPVERLQEMKASAAQGQQPDPAKAWLIAQVVVAGSGNVVSVGQTGGQTAHTIINEGLQARDISDEAARAMITDLAPHASTSVGFASFAGDPEAAAFKRRLMTVFSRAGWDVHDQATFMFFGDRTGVILTIPFGVDESDEAALAAMTAIDRTGQLTGGNRGDMANEHGLYVQVWPQPQ